MKVAVLGEAAPIARWILRNLRDKGTGPDSFKRWMWRAGLLLASHVSGELAWREVKVTTPLGVEAVEYEPAAEPLLVGVLGASLPLLEGFSTLYPGAPVGLVAARRLEEDERVRVKIYYERLPATHKGPAVIVDPMLATGYTIGAVARHLLERGVEKVIAATVIASSAGISYLESSRMVDAVYTLAVDPALNERFFIVPGLGDAGDRSLGVAPA